MISSTRDMSGLDRAFRHQRWEIGAIEAQASVCRPGRSLQAYRGRIGGAAPTVADDPRLLLLRIVLGVADDGGPDARPKTIHSVSARSYLWAGRRAGSAGTLGTVAASGGAVVPRRTLSISTQSASTACSKPRSFRCNCARLTSICLRALSC